MITFSIDGLLKAASSHLQLGVITASVVVTKREAALWKEIDQISQRVSQLTFEQVHAHAAVKSLGEAYRNLGKDPSRYRSSAEALARRVISGKPLYQINTVVDINNAISLSTLHSVGSYNVDRLKGSFVFRVGSQGETYKGIGKDLINIEDLPVFADSDGPFGSPTSDSERAMITLDAKRIMMVIIDFMGDPNLENHCESAAKLLTQFAQATNIETSIVT